MNLVRSPWVNIAFAARMFWRDWRGGEFGILAVSLIIAVTSITTVNFFTDRIDRGLSRQSSELLAADLLITAPHPLKPDYEKLASEHGLQTAYTMQFRSVVLANAQPQLVEVKAVSKNYPLRGELSIADGAFSTPRTSEAIPAQGKTWVEARLLQLLDLQVGSQLQLGEVNLTISQVLAYEPDRGGDMFSVAPRIMINYEDVAASNLIQTGALASYRLLVAGDAVMLDAYRKQQLRMLAPGERIIDVEGGRPELRSALNRAKQFLGLAALISVLLAGVAVASAARRFALRHLDTSAMLRCLGATQATIINIIMLEMLFLSLISSTIGCLLGLLAQSGISKILGALMLTSLPPPSPQPLLLGYATGVIMLLGFALPPLLSLRNVPPLRVLRREQTGPVMGAGALYLAVLLSMAMLLYWQTGELRLVVVVMLGMLVTLLALAIAAYGMIMILNHLRQRVGVAWRFGLSNIARHQRTSIIQMVVFGLGIMLLLLVSTVNNDLLRGWKQSLPADAPNHFIINVQADQLVAIRDFFKAQGLGKPGLYPMVRARLTQINGRTVSTADYESERARHLLTREFNLSWAVKPQKDNAVIAGKWWQEAEHGRPLLSLETGLAKTLRLKLHDKVSFLINGRLQEFTISNLRSVDWDTFNINFFTVVPPGVLEQEPASWVTSIYIHADKKASLGQLVRQFPNVTVIDIEAIMDRVRNIMGRAIFALEFILLFILLAGLAVLYASIQSSLDGRRYETAVMRTLGARTSVLLRGLISEFVTLGALAGLLAGLAATSLTWFLASYVFHFPYQFSPQTGLAGIVLGILVVGIAGTLGTYRVLTHPPLQSLRYGT